MDQHNYFDTTGRELLFGLAAVMLGLFGANMVFCGGFRLGFAITVVLSIALSWGYLRRCGYKGSGYSTCVLVLCMIIAAGFGWSSDAFVKLWMLLFLMVGVNLALCLMAGRNRFTPGSARSLRDARRTIFGLGLGRMGKACWGIVQAFRSGGVLTQRSGAVLAGLAIAVPALALVIPLLISSDAAFAGLVSLLPDFDLRQMAFTVVGGALMGLFIYTRAVALVREACGEEPEREHRQLRALTMNTALGTVCAVYLVYLFSQLAYFVGGFSGILPEGFTRAEYARRGFFEMTCLAGINLCLMIFGITKVRKDTRAPGSTRMLCLFLGLVTEFMAFSSGAKMVMYIGSYGLTRLRVLTMVIMVFLGITTALIALWLYLPKLPYMKAVMLTALAIGAAVLWLDVDTQVAKYNVEHYLSGDLAHIDLGHLSALGYGAVPYVQQLTECADPNIREQARVVLEEWYLVPADDFRDITVLKQRAAEILDQYHPEE